MKVETKSIHEVLSMNNSSFFIPPFQRAYAWGSQEINRFLDDLLRIIHSECDIHNNDKLEHFFGVLVFKTEPDGFASRSIVVDGQQRLTTTLLMLIALRDSNDNKTFKKNIEDNYLKNANSTFDDKIKLKQVTNDWDAYKAIINNEDKVPGKLTDGYQSFLSKLLEPNFSAIPPIEFIKALSKINVACIFLDDRPYKGEDPQIIFETLNSLGKPLTLADLIRNYVLLNMPSIDQTDIFEKIWHPRIENVLQDKSSQFFRDYMQYKECKYFKVVSDSNTKELYAQFKEFVEKAFNNKKDLIDDICRYVTWYQWIVEINSSVTITSDNNFNNQILELLRNIFHDIKADSFKPVVLGLLEYNQSGFNNRKLPDIQLIEALKVIRTYLIRRRVLKLTQGENKDIPKLVKEICGNQALIADAKTELFNLLSKGIYSLRLPNNNEVANELKRIDFYNSMSKYCKLILGKIEEYISKVSVDFRDAKITIEHIMPRETKKSKDWKGELGKDWEEVHKKYLHNIGNLILTEFNSEMGNKSLKLKKDKLQSSNLLYRNDVLNRSTWNIKDIESHQAKMIDRFLLTFPLPSHMQSADNWDEKNVSTVQDIFSPLEDDVSRIATGKTPNAILINDEIYIIETWQDVFLTFLRWLNNNNPYMFGRVLNPDDVFSGSGQPIVAASSIVSTIIENDEQLKNRYKRLSDGTLYARLDKINDGDIFVFINQSAQTIINRIGHVMNILNMSEESVTIELK